MFTDSRCLLAASIVLATLVGAWMFRYETVFGNMHINRFTGQICLISEECWFSKPWWQDAPVVANADPIDDWQPIRK